MRTLTVFPHPLLSLHAFTAHLPEADEGAEGPTWLQALLAADAETPLSRSEAIQKAGRDLLRHGGFKPTGRSKPASEYLVRAATEGTLRSIHPLVDAGNVVSLHSGLAISVVDATRLQGALHVGLAAPETRYVFNPAGQELDASGLLCLHDEVGPCANAVKDAQRTKLGADSRSGLWLIWGTQTLPEVGAAAEAYARELLARLSAEIEDVQLVAGDAPSAAT